MRGLSAHVPSVTRKRQACQGQVTKFPVAGFEAIESVLRPWGAQPVAAHVETDHYYNAPDRDFGRTDEALRLRRIADENCLTYKGPRHPGPTKTRTEIELPLKTGDD